MADVPEKVKYIYTRSPEHRIVPANSAFGGVTPRGDFRIDFLVESVGLPERIEQVLSQGQFGPEERTPRETEGVFYREAVVTVMIPLQHAKGIGQWMIDMVDRWEKQQGKGGNGKE